MKKLFNELMALCDDQSKFFMKDCVGPNGEALRIFSYNYASYTDWCRPSALECRGIMFDITKPKKPVIVCRPMEKFFNLDETPFTMNLDLEDVDFMMNKEDGSLVSSFKSGEHIYLKSKGSINSEQAVAANMLLSSPEYEPLMIVIKDFEESGYTVNMEYTSPTNRIVLEHEVEKLTVLNVRHRETGEYFNMHKLFNVPAIRAFLVEIFPKQPVQWVAAARQAEGIEGFVVRMKNGLHFKLKTDWYCTLHKTKDSITRNDELFGVIAANGQDDLKGLFRDDEFALAKIAAFEDVFFDEVATQVNDVMGTFKSMAGLERREVAIRGQQIFKGKPQCFHALMDMYKGKTDFVQVQENIIKAFLKSYDKYVPAEYK
ncbi:RNA ligase [Cronobacter phage vB_Cdu_VP8]|nr:RNA ligase [Cronobacter phage vB_Cdu_VP8]